MKLKTRKAALKRVKRKKNSLERKKAYKSHLLRKKNSKRLRRLSESAKIHPADISSYSLLLPYSS
jgi:large subunit ribosomal protein L35